MREWFIKGTERSSKCLEHRESDKRFIKIVQVHGINGLVSHVMQCFERDYGSRA